MSSDWHPEADLSYGAKQAVVAEYFDAYQPAVVVETGLYNRNGSGYQFLGRAEVVAIDLDPVNVDDAMRRGVHAWLGSSADVLPGVLRQIDRPALFWLDAHTNTEVGDVAAHSPLLAELEAILAWPHAAQSVVLVDDLRLMCQQGWPSLGEVLALTEPVWACRVEADILRCVPR